MDGVSCTNPFGITNTGTGNRRGDYTLHVSLDSAKVPSPVPLPAAAWLLLSGVGVLGLLGRRRKTA